MSNYNTTAAMLAALTTLIKNGGVNGSVTTDDIYEALEILLDNAGLLKATVTIDAADLYTINSVTIQVLEGQDSELATLPVLLIAKKGSGAFVGANDFSLRYEHGTDDLLTMPATGFLDQANKTVVFASAFDSLIAPAGDALELYSAKDPTASGGSTINFTIFYRLI